MTIRCVVESQSLPAPDEQVAVELYVCREFDSSVPQPALGQRRPITLATLTGRYRGGLRTLQQSNSVYLCPDLITESDGTKISLAKILKENGIEPKDEIDVRIHDDEWEIGTPQSR